MKHILFVFMLIAAVCFSSMRKTNDQNKLLPVINAVSNPYDQHMFLVDSFPKVYPTYFYDSGRGQIPEAPAGVKR